MRLMMQIFNRIALLLTLVCASYASELQAKMVTVEVSGTGLVKEAAIEKALIQAIRQVNGVDIKSQSRRSAAQLKVNGKRNAAIASESVTAMLTKGQVSRYQVINENCDSEQCEVLLSVELPVYKSPGLSPTKRRKLVVLPFVGDYGRDFSKNLQTLLVQSRRFAILDRENNALYQKEKRLLLSGDTALEEKMRLGQVLGLDYIVTGDVKAMTDNSVSKVTLTGEQESHFSQTSIINYQVINLATRQIKWQDQASLSTDIMSLDSARNISRTITSAIYPMKVVGHSAGQIILNQGGKNIEKGAIYDVYALGAKLIDPYTKESLGQEEIKIGKVKIARVSPKVSYARLLTGSLSKMKKNSILRLASLNETMNSNSQYTVPIKSTVAVSSAGGILLPPPAKKSVKASPKGGVIIQE